MNKCLMLSWFLIMCMISLWVISPRISTAAMKELSLDQLTVQSSAVIDANVLSKKSWWNSDKTLIFTTVNIHVKESLKGNMSPADTISIMVPGGEIDGVGLGVEHAPKFTVGEEVIVFLRPIDDDHYGVTGWEQGKLTIIDKLIKENGESVEAIKDQIRGVLENVPESEEEE